ncbi:hypothetical protein HPULCUR_008375 [Helicostylum pulchrum]|uniref:Ribosomal protein L1 n=1 Tax=Helicostylum pulchrum TaxID=562976 RepID=A0ABP9Y829_9FUNG
MSVTINEEKAKKAFKALFKHEAQHGEKEEDIWLMVSTFRKITLTSGRPTRIVLKHGCQTPGVHRCLFVKKDQQKYKNIIKEKKIRGVHKVLDIKHIKKLYPTPQSKQALMDEYDMFMGAKNIIKDLQKVLGRDVYKKRREPIPIDLNKPDLQKEILRTAKSTFMNFHTGSCHAIRIATTGQDPTIAFENLMSAYEKIVAAVPGGDRNIRSFQIKTANSTSLPVYDASTDFVNDGYQSDELVI